MKSRQQAAEQAEIMVDAETQVFMRWLQAQGQMCLIQSYRNEAYQVKQEVLNKALKRLKKGESAEDVLQFLAHTLTNKLLHTPSRSLNKAAYAGNNELLNAAKKLLNIQEIT